MQVATLLPRTDARCSAAACLPPPHPCGIPKPCSCDQRLPPKLLQSAPAFGAALGAAHASRGKLGMRVPKSPTLLN